MSTTVSITLSRAHKVAERLKTQAHQLLQDAAQAAAPATVSGTSAGQAERLRTRGDTVAPTLGTAQRYLRANAIVRAVISRENEARGISAKLAQLDAVNKLLTSHKGIVDSTKAAALMLHELEGYKPLAGEGAMYGGLTVNVVNATNLEAVKASLAALQRESVQLADEIAEANAARVSFELDEDLAAFATGAA